MSSIVDIMQKARRLLMRRGASLHDAEDLVQEAFARVEAYSRETEARHPEQTLMRTALNLAIDEARRRRRAPFERGVADLDLVVDTGPRPDEMLRARERLGRLREGLEALNPRARRILLAQRVDGLSYKEIARQEGVTVAAVEKSIARSVMFLTEWLEQW